LWFKGFTGEDHGVQGELVLRFGRVGGLQCVKG